MSKKRTVATIIVFVIMVALNVLILCHYDMPIANKKVDFNITLESDRVKEFELFYLTEADGENQEFKAEQVATAKYEQENTEKRLTFSVPATVEAIRLDFGGEESDTVISDMQIRYKKQSIDIEQATLKQAERSKDIQNVVFGDKITVTAAGGDPYLACDVKSYNIADMVKSGDAVGNIILKILLCIVLDIIAAVCLKYGKVLLSLPVELFHNRKLIFNLAKNDFKTKYAGSYLGIIWAFVQPIVTIIVYWFVFEKGLKAGGINTKAGITAPFVLWLTAGIVPWFFFQDAWNGATNALMEYAYLVKKVVFKVSILPIIKMISAWFVHLFFIAFILLLYACYGYYPDIYTLQVIYYSAAMFLLVLGLSYATSAIVLFFKDLTQIINLILQVGVWVTPIMWNIDTMELPPVLLQIFKLNPMYYIVAGYRDALINKVWFFEHPGESIYFWIVTMSLLGIGMLIFKRLRVHFADVL